MRKTDGAEGISSLTIREQKTVPYRKRLELKIVPQTERSDHVRSRANIPSKGLKDYSCAQKTLNYIRTTHMDEKPKKDINAENKLKEPN